MKEISYESEGVQEKLDIDYKNMGRPPQLPLRDMRVHEVMFIWPYSKLMWRKLHNITAHLKRTKKMKFIWKRDTKNMGGKVVDGIRIQRLR